MAAHLQERNLTFFEHLEELRGRIIRCAIAMAFGMVAGYLAAPWVIQQLTKPFQQLNATRAMRTLDLEVRADGALAVRATASTAGAETLTSATAALDAIRVFRGPGDAPAMVLGNAPSGIIYTRPMDPFLTTLRVALWLSVVFSLPVILYQLWAFVNPGLMPKERRYLWPFIVCGILLFSVGATFAYVSLRFALEFFAQFVQEGAYLYNDMGAYLGFALTTMIAFGVTFQLPLVTLLLTRVGIVSADALARQRRTVFVVLLVIAALITPTQDPLTLMLMAGPLYALFEVSLLVSRSMDRAEITDSSAVGADDGRTV